MHTLLQRRAASERATPILIGVVHLLPCPGSPRFGGDFEAVLARAEADAQALGEGGADALIVENFGDAPFFAEQVPAETVAALALALARVRAASGGQPLGVNVLRNDARAALGLCATTAASFLRINVHTGAMLTDQGLIQGRAAVTLRERQRLAPSAAILADVHVKHATPLGDQDLVDAAHDAFHRGAADALVISGTRTGAEPSNEDLVRLRTSLGQAPLLIGSGLTLANAPAFLPHIDGAIVGTSLKHEGRVGEPVDVRRVRALAQLFRGGEA